mmetsp:Transcript_52464/g.137369  ORF Transcript_52464/g.137369 Transcript_52464/m.137369 type:complete len:378 (+) Transcript_52464:7660-8793(+)
MAAVSLYLTYGYKALTTPVANTVEESLRISVRCRAAHRPRAQAVQMLGAMSPARTQTGGESCPQSGLSSWKLKFMNVPAGTVVDTKRVSDRACRSHDPRPASTLLAGENHAVGAEPIAKPLLTLTAPLAVCAPPRLEIVTDEPACNGILAKSVTIKVLRRRGYGVLWPMSATKKVGAYTRSGAASPCTSAQVPAAAPTQTPESTGIVVKSLSTATASIGTPPNDPSPRTCTGGAYWGATGLKMVNEKIQLTLGKLQATEPHTVPAPPNRRTSRRPCCTARPVGSAADDHRPVLLLIPSAENKTELGPWRVNEPEAAHASSRLMKATTAQSLHRGTLDERVTVRVLEAPGQGVVCPIDLVGKRPAMITSESFAKAPGT